MHAVPAEVVRAHRLGLDVVPMVHTDGSTLASLPQSDFVNDYAYSRVGPG